MKVLYYKKTNLAKNPDIWAKLMKKYRGIDTEVVSSLSGKKFNFVHFNNTFENFEELKTKSLMHYHGHPKYANNHGSLMKDFPGQVIINAQHYAHGSVPTNFKPIKWFPIEHESRFYDVTNPTNKIIICYSPSKKSTPSNYHSKGYQETLPILRRIQDRFPRLLEIKIIVGAPYEICLLEKAKSNIVIDECVTGNYHMSGFEGLGMGKMVIGKISKENEDLMLNKLCPSANRFPYENVDIDGLEAFLEDIVRNKGLEFVLNRGRENKEWILNNWSLESVLDEMLDNYREVLGDNGAFC